MRPRWLPAAILVVAASVLAVGCGSDDDPSDATDDTTTARATGSTGTDGTGDGEADPGGVDVATPAVEGTTWELDASASEHPAGTLPEVNVQLRLEDGSVSGSDGCNRVTGSYTLDGDAIEFGELAGTMMACPEPPDAMESAARYVASLQSGGTVEVVDAGEGATTLVLTTNDGATLRYHPEAPPAPLDPTALVGTWEMTLEEQQGEGDTASASASPVGTIDLGEDGTLSGQGPCNPFEGTYTADDMAAFDVASLTHTEISCGGVVDGMEAAAFGHLNQAENWGRLPGGTVELLGDDPTVRILLNRVP